MILEQGNKLFVSQRRLYENDEPRFFVGEVLYYENGFVKIRGYTFVRDFTTGSMLRKDEERIKVISLDSYGFLVYQLPDAIDVDDIYFENIEGQILMKDQSGLNMNMAEYPRRGKF